MPKQKNNIVMRSTRGMFGKQVVFKERAGETYVAAPPEVNENRKPTAPQLVMQQRFTKSALYASAAIKDADIKKLYAAAAKRNQSAYNVALRDAFTTPVVEGIITQGYLGQADNIIVAQATDDFMVKAVSIAIHSSANELIESGDAIANIDGLNWTYTVTQANANIAGSVITATAVDLPGNEGSLEVTL